MIQRSGIRQHNTRNHFWFKTLLIWLVVINYSLTACAQLIVQGTVVDAYKQQPLAFVNIGIKNKNVGTASIETGAFSLRIPPAHKTDTLTFSLVGYQEQHIAISSLRPNAPLTIRLVEHVAELSEVSVVASKLVEKKFGIKHRNLLLHFTDGMFMREDIFEIGQVIKLGDKRAQITSVNLHINTPRTDSATFRINFYRYENGLPTHRLVERSIVQRHSIREGWLRFDLTNQKLQLRGTFVAAIELMPDVKKGLAPIVYEVKLGGFSKSVYRRSSLGKWNTPPHHYCLYVTALVDKNSPDETEDCEITPTLVMYAKAVNDSFRVFINLPHDYQVNSTKRYPVIYHLDGNAYFGHVSQAVAELRRKGELFVEPIVVGIGYKDAYVMDSLRVRDYTYPAALASDSLPVSGGGEKFYQFIKNELLPLIDKTYRTDTIHRTLMGHSFGGYFTLYTLLRDLSRHATFTTYVAASPSLWFGNNYLPDQFRSLPPAKLAAKPPKLLLTAGELEVQADKEQTFERFRQTMEHQTAVQIVYRIYEGLDHMGAAVPAFQEGTSMTGKP